MKCDPFPDVYLPIHQFFKSLGQNLEYLQRLFDLLPLGVYVTNTKGVIIYYNRAHARLDNLSPREVLGRPEVEVFGFPEVSPGIMRTCQKTGRPILGFMCPYFTHKDPYRVINGAYWVFPLFDEQKNISGSLCFTIPVGDSHEPTAASPQNWLKTMPMIKSSKKIVGDNVQLRKAIVLAKVRADSPSPVLICGETGTGKELFARLIHDSSRRAARPFLPINCAAIPAHLLESLLFGTTKGSFTGAMDKPGLLEEAAGGTIYLDEIDSMPVELQPKLLRVLQEMKVGRLGSSREIKLDVKIISSISTSVQEIMAKRKLRPDLFYRLAVMVIQAPPLRERMDDLDELINYFIAKHNRSLGQKVVAFDARSKAWLRQYLWPGNVRELENLVAGAINLAGNESILTMKHLPDHYLYMIEHNETGKDLLFELEDGLETGLKKSETGPEPSPAGETPRLGTFHEEERRTIETYLTAASGRMTAAATSMGISRQLLRYKMQKYGLDRYDYLPRLGQGRR
ncbi:MAG: sigma 54-interacting transcriptional regulator [Candidatus Adiutrix sp.]|jgi:arginine utilization regulatory protein|nr:sigma 54-interacting transcriptional regulator [Candidatus Adiutrix sp.]